MNKFLNFIVGAVLLASTAFAFADDFKLERIGVHVASKHFPYRGQNETNPGLYVSFTAFGVNGLVLGGYRNSQDANSLYFGKNFEISVTNRINAGITIGGVTGYKKQWQEYVNASYQQSYINAWGQTMYYTILDYKVVDREKRYPLLPLISPTVTYAVTSQTAVRLNVIPAGIKKGHSTAVGLSLEYRFN